MSELSGMLWAEFRKAIRSRMPLWTSLGSLFLPMSIAFLLFVARNPEISQKLGLVGAKANLVMYSGADWAAYLGLFTQMVSAGVFILLVLSISWVFGREFTDGTVKDLLAVPVRRSSILLAKFILIAAWAGLLTLVVFALGFPDGSVAQAAWWIGHSHSGGQRQGSAHRLPDHPGGAAVRIFCQRRQGVPASARHGCACAFDGKPGSCDRLG